MGLMFLILTGWQYPLALTIHILLLIYCSRPSRYSIYLFLQEVSQMLMLFYMQICLQLQICGAQNGMMF
jgi:hypothetical protein